MNPDLVQQTLRDYDALRRTDSDPELEAVRTAILLEDIFDITLSDADIDLVARTDAVGLAALVNLRQGSA